MLFNALADAVDANTELGNQLINLSQDTNKKILDAVGISSLVPSLLQQLQDGAYNASRDLNQKIGDANSTVLRNLE
ncbi:hypothetical protein N7488_008875 [Penicillium malachiteum]|nr:hypothetical protein N7488_008875 [Penicillium malachiteum]